MKRRSPGRGEQGSTLVLALVMTTAFALVALAAGRYAVVNMADTVVTRERTAALEAASGGARLAIATVERDPSACTAPSATPFTVPAPGLNGLDPTVTCRNAASPSGRTIVVESSAGGRTVHAEARVGTGTPAAVAITSWVVA